MTNYRAFEKNKTFMICNENNFVNINQELISKKEAMNFLTESINSNLKLVSKEKQDKNIKLYRYRPFNEYTLKEIVTNQIFLARPDLLNDPYDCYLIFENNDFISYHLEKISANTKFGDLLKLKDTEIIKFKNSYGIASFSEENDNLLMWSHYSTNHKGICLEYDLSDIYSNIIQMNSNLNVFPVSYVKNIKKSKVSELEESQIKLPDFLYRKSENWEYEKEWRIIKQLNNKSNPPKGELLKFVKPKAIFLGANMDLDNVNFIKLLIKDKGIKLFKMRLRKDKFELENKEIIQKENYKC